MTSIYDELLVNKLNKLKKVNQDDLDYPDALTSINTINKYLNPDTYVIDSIGKTISDLEYDLLRLKQVKFMLNDFKDFYNLTKDTSISLDINNKNLTIDNKKDIRSFMKEKNNLINNVYNFYKNGTDKDIYNDFLTFYNQRKRNLFFLNTDPKKFYADSFYLPYHNELLIQMSLTHSINDISILAHEYGHGISNLYYYDENMYNNNPLYMEIASSFFQLISLDYYTNIPESKDMAINAIKDYYNSIIQDINDLNNILNIYDNINVSNLNKKDIRDNLIEYQNNHLIENYINNYHYIFGELIAIELYHIYQNDKELCFNILKQIMSINLNNNPEKVYEELLNLNILPNEHVDEFNKILNKRK